MNPNDDYTPLVTLLRRARLHAPINQDHKDRLRRQLFDASQPIPVVWRRLMAAASFAIVLFAAVYYVLQPVKPIVGVALWHFNTTQPANIRMGEWVETGRDSLVVILFDQSKLHFEPFSEFCIASSTSDRAAENAVIVLKRGVLDASVPKQLDHALIVRTPDANVRVTGTKFRVEVKID